MTRVGSSRDNTDDSVQASEAAHVNIVRVDLSGLTLLTVILLVTVIGGCGVVMGIDIASRHAQDREFDRRAAQAQREDDQRAADLKDAMVELKRQYRMTELKLDDWAVVAHRSGLVLPGDYTRGPQGNLDSESFKQEKADGSRRDNPTKSSGAVGRNH